MRLTSFSPTSVYPSLDLDRHGYLARVAYNGVHPFGHRSSQPGLCVRRLLYVTFDDHLIVADENRYGPWTLARTLLQESQRQLQAVGCGSLDRRVEAVS